MTNQTIERLIELTPEELFEKLKLITLQDNFIDHIIQLPNTTSTFSYRTTYIVIFHKI